MAYYYDIIEVSDDSKRVVIFTIDFVNFKHRPLIVFPYNPNDISYQTTEIYTSVNNIEKSEDNTTIDMGTTKFEIKVIDGVLLVTEKTLFRDEYDPRSMKFRVEEWKDKECKRSRFNCSDYMPWVEMINELKSALEEIEEELATLSETVGGLADDVSEEDE